MATHLAAVAVAKAQPLEVQERRTPKPGHNELLLDVKSIALNPLDISSKDFGFAIAEYPAVFGSDISGVVLETGPNVSAAAFKPGTRVAAIASAFFAQGAPDYGAFQQRVIVPVENAGPIPDDVSFNEAATLPMAVTTVCIGWDTIGLPRETSYSPGDKQGVLIWGASVSTTNTYSSDPLSIPKSQGVKSWLGHVIKWGMYRVNY